jgi:hypothetical protein
VKYQVFYDKRPLRERAGQPMLGVTHVFVREVEADSLGHVFTQMQGEVWSPNGEARMLIEYLGLSHTSMSVDDIAVDEYGVVSQCMSYGWQEIPVNNMATCRFIEAKSKSIDAEGKVFDFGAWFAGKPLAPNQWQRIGEIAEFLDLSLAMEWSDYNNIPDFLRVGEGVEFVLDAVYGMFIHPFPAPHEVYI